MFTVQMKVGNKERLTDLFVTKDYLPSFWIYIVNMPGWKYKEIGSRLDT